MSPHPHSTRPSQPVLQQAQQVAWAILEVANRLQENFAQHAAFFNLTAVQAKLLMTVEPGRSASMRQLAERINVEPSNLTSVVDRLEERGALRRVPSAVDRRVKDLVLTEAGSQVRADFLARLTSSAGPLGVLNHYQLQDLQDALAPLVTDQSGA